MKIIYEDFLVAANIISVFPELDEETLDSALAEDDKNFIVDTVSGTMENKVDIDNLINAQAKNWSTLRMVSADKNILRMGIYELVFSKEKIDAAVIINEAVDLARIYGEEESYKFVNAILDAIYKKEMIMSENGIVKVAHLNDYIKAMFEHDDVLQNIRVEGEISNFKRHASSGHCYFSIKDDKAAIRCVMFRSAADQMRTLPRNGQSVVFSRKRIGLYKNWGLSALCAPLNACWDW